jgi:2-methylcitrate dehydratase
VREDPAGLTGTGPAQTTAPWLGAEAAEAGRVLGAVRRLDPAPRGWHAGASGGILPPMDKTSRALVDYVEGLDPGKLPEPVLHEAKRRLVDSMGCAIGAVGAPPAAIARSLAGLAAGSLSATAIGLPRRTSVEMATFANTVMVRYLDYNDMYFTARGGGGHPSDLIPTSLAVGQAVGASGAEVLASIVAAYEVNGALASAVRLRERGWDQGLHIVAAGALAAGKLLGLSGEQLGHALSLAVTPNVPVRQTRVGQLSMWKGCATAAAARNGVFAALLASRGMTGPSEPFEGTAGIWEQVTGPFQVEIPVRPGGFAVSEIATKTRPAEYHAQGPLDLMMELRRRVDAAEVERIEVETYWLAWDEIGSQPEKWDPRTRETADHSLPYLLAVALVDGEITQRSFTPERVGDPALRPVMDRIVVTERPEFTERFPGEILSRITIRLRSGRQVSGETAYPRGHARNPASDAEIDAKFSSLAGARPPAEEDRCQALRRELWRLESVGNVAPLLEPLGELDAG